LTVAIYPASFDPIHYGHIDIAKRSACIFDRVIVAVYDRPLKNLLFNIDERLQLAEQALRDQRRLPTNDGDCFVAHDAPRHDRGIVTNQSRSDVIGTG
jgi:cytidyltransferase-like protein